MTSFFLSKHIKEFQWPSKSKLLIFMTDVFVSKQWKWKKKNKTLFRGTYLNLTLYPLYQKIFKYFNDFQSQTFLVLWLHWTRPTEMKQNQTFTYGKYSNLISFFIGRKILKYFNDFYDWHFSIALQKWAKASRVK